MAKRKRRSKSPAKSVAPREKMQQGPASASEPARQYSRSDWIALGAFFVSGFVALVYEICWIRKSSVAFGTASFALSTVLAVFFGGLSLGSYLFGRRVASFRRPLRVYAWLEIGISVWAALTPITFWLLDIVYGMIFRLTDHSFMALTMVRAGLVVVAIFPATLLMGASLPIFCRHFVTSANRVSAPVGLLYGVNTLGAAAGCAVCGFFLIPTIGIITSLLLAAGINLLMAAVMFRVAKSVPDSEVIRGTAQQSQQDQGERDQLRRLYLVFFGTGFVALGYEILWSRYLSLVIFNNIYNHTLTITVILLGIVCGSLISSKFGDRGSRRALAFGVLQMASGISVLAILLLPPSLWGMISPNSFGVTVGVCFLVLFPPAILSGASFPLAMRMAVTKTEHAASRVGIMTAMNTVGGIVGSVVAGFMLLPVIGLQSSLRLMTGCSLLIGVTALLLFDKTLSRNARGIGILIAAGIWIAIPNVLKTKLPDDFLHGGRQLVEVSEGIGVNMAVLNNPVSRTRELEINRLWQGQDRKNHQIMAAHIPTIIHPNPRSVLMVGVGCGQTASRFLMHDIETLECVEIESGLVDLIQRHFPNQWMEDERVKVIIEDGRNYLAHTAKRFDIISLEVGQVFRPGVAGFYTLDFYRSAQRKLNPDGLLCQFVPINLLSPHDFHTIVNTFLQAFPQSTLWYNRAELLLVGKNAEQFTISLDRLRSLSKAARADMEFAYWAGSDYSVNKPEIFLSGILAGPEELSALSRGALIYRDDRPWLEYRLAPENSYQITNANKVADHLVDPNAILSKPLAAVTLKAVTDNRRLNLRSLHVQAIIESAVGIANSGQTAQAMQVFDQAANLLPMHLVAQLNLAKGYLQNPTNMVKAEEHARNALRIDPLSPDAHFVLSQVLNRKDVKTEAQKHLDKANELAPRMRW